MARHKQPTKPLEREVQPPLPEMAPDMAGMAKPQPEEVIQSAKAAVAPNDYSDWLFGGSFVAAAVFGLGNAINHIRHNFYESFVKPPTDVLDLKKTTDIEARKQHPFADLFRARKRAYQDLSSKFELYKETGGKQGISGLEMAAQKIKATIDHDREVSNYTQKHFGIRTKGFHSWVTDVWKQREHTGTFARRQAAFTMATTTVLGIAAISTLKYTKHLLDRIDENEKQQEEFLAQRNKPGSVLADSSAALSATNDQAQPLPQVSQATHDDRVTALAAQRGA